MLLFFLFNITQYVQRLFYRKKIGCRGNDQHALSSRILNDSVATQTTIIKTKILLGYLLQAIKLKIPKTKSFIPVSTKIKTIVIKILKADHEAAARIRPIFVFFGQEMMLIVTYNLQLSFN
jgi:hypothetical protein